MKKKYYEALKINNGRLDEIDLGEIVGLDEDATRKIISMLLCEYKIAYKTNAACNYRIIK